MSQKVQDAACLIELSEENNSGIRDKVYTGQKNVKNATHPGSAPRDINRRAQ